MRETKFLARFLREKSLLLCGVCRSAKWRNVGDEDKMALIETLYRNSNQFMANNEAITFRFFKLESEV